LAAVEFIGYNTNSRSAHRHQVGRDQLKLAEGVKEMNREYQRRYKELAKKMGVEYEVFHGVSWDDV
jgi:acyl-CoA dehydrogenase